MNERLVPRSSTVYTPSDLAAAMVRVASWSHSDLWLDPCVGDGAFVVEMAGAGIRPERIYALDIALRPSVCDRLARTIRGVDFIEWAGRNGGSVDRIVMNPPYVAINRLGGAPQRNALSVSLANGRKLTLGANYWCAFLIKALGCLRSGGTLVAVLPAAWDFARYAAGVRSEVEQSFEHLTVIRCSSPLFPHVKDGAVVLVGKNRGEAAVRHERIEVANLHETVAALELLGTGGRPRGSTTIRTIAKRETHRARLDSFVEIGIGAVTGDAHYFLLSEAERSELGLPLTSVRPVLSRCKQLVAAVMDERQWQALRDAGERVWLFRPGLAARKQAAVKSYLWHGARGECNMSAYKVRSRPQWHQTPLPRRVDGFFSGMSKKLPFLVLQAMPGLTATNTLYVVRFRSASTASERAALGVLLLTSDVRRELRRHVRNYADGLLKFEPRELGGIQVPVVHRHTGAISVFKRATALLLDGREADSEALADDWATMASGSSAPARAPRRNTQPSASRRSA